MSDVIVGIDLNGVKFLYASGVRLVRLEKTGIAATNLTFHDTQTNADYQVPVGKKFTIIYLASAGMGDAGDKIFYADNADGNTNAVTLIQAGVGYTNQIFISAEVPAGKYVNMIDANAHVYSLYGIEEDA